MTERMRKNLSTALNPSGSREKNKEKGLLIKPLFLQRRYFGLSFRRSRSFVSKDNNLLRIKCFDDFDISMNF